jgi:hypothetical protein
VNDFKRDLSYSLEQREEKFWKAVYYKAFPNLTDMRICHDLDRQRKGVDRLVTLSSGDIIAIDEKKRRKQYTDILLEYISVDRNNAPGWIEKDLAIDFLAYAFMPSKQVYLFSWPLLKRVWNHYGDRWINYARDKQDGFSIIVARNKSYNTYSVAVPRNILMKSIQTAAIIDVSKEFQDG